ncbi:MAG: hypothetical protein KKA73_23605 [Chloroflexi bacterium]|nr:hypothetical protein [Chloroflexota bacterium]MBU1750679.1 hypothetical protein [Chloroflexota bacterium]
MARYGLQTKQSPEQVIEKAIAYFQGDLGLTVDQQDPCCVSFTGGGGSVSVSASAGERHTEVELLTREWDYQVRQFMHQIA